MPPAIVLASTAPWRLQLLRDVGVDARGVAPGVEESAITGSTPERTAVARAEAKASAVSIREPGALVIGADQVAHLGSESFGKPESEEAWRARLRRLRGRTHTLTTGVAFAQDGVVVDSFAVVSEVRFRADLSDAELDAYVAHGEARGCAGGYMAERLGAWLIAEVHGDWFNVIGLPVFAVLDRLRARGYRLPVASE